ncbi:hypothetical protein [Streptomyces prasinus]|nr:hypothetical protein A4U61_00665 [Streptomyces sp. H-KF8]
MGLFDDALSNGLAAIVAYEWPGEEQGRRGRVESARALLEVIEEHMPATDGIVLLLDGQPVPKLPQADTDTSSRARDLSSHTRVDVNTLLDGIKVGCSSFRGTG